MGNNGDMRPILTERPLDVGADIDAQYFFVLLLTALFWFLSVGPVQAAEGSDFLIQRGSTTITGTNTTITAGVDYTAPTASTSAFIRITNTHMTGAGDTNAATTQNANDVTAYIVDPWNITSSVTFSRAAGAASTTRIDWEIVEYTGTPAGENEIIVRQQQYVTYGTTNTSVSGPAVPNVSDDNDIAVFVTGQFNPDTGTADYNTGLSTAVWNSGSDNVSLTRGEAGNDAAITSYAVVEFTGSNWQVQRVSDHVYTATGTTETASITAVNSLSRAFLHVQKRVANGLSTHADFGHEVWLSGIGQLSYRLNPDAGSPGDHVSAVWVIENTQTNGDVLEVTRSNGIQAGGGAPLTVSVPIGKTLDDLSVSSIFMNNSASGTTSTWPEPMMAVTIASSTHYEIWISDTSDARSYRTEIVEWPSAERVISQNYYYLYVNNDALTPTDPWPPGVSDIGENSGITGLDDPLATGDTIRIRMTLNVSSGAMPPGVDAFTLQYGERISTCSAITGWSNLGGIGSTTALWRGTTTAATDGETLGSLLISVSDVAGTFEEENNTALTPDLVQVGEDIEFDWAIENNGAAEKTDYCFRMIEDDGTEFQSYNFYPTVRSVGYGAESRMWRWYGDAENETPLNALAATNTAPVDVAFDDAIQLRLALREVNGADGSNVKFRLQFSEYSDFSTSTYVSEIADCIDGASLWCYTDGGGSDNATITTALLEDADSCSSGSGPGCGTHNESGTTTSSYIHGTGDISEFSFALRNAGARVNRVYYFRVYDHVNDEVVTLGDGQSYPSLVTEGAGMVFGMSSVSSSTVIDGETIDVDSTATRIDFGTLPFGSKVAGAQRLSIDTNGTEGYKVYMYSTSYLINDIGSVIQPIAGTNASPLAWSTGCTSDAVSCFGYHTDDSTLEGGSGRFSANDTFARLSTTTPEEVAFSTNPTPGDTTDIVFKLQIGTEQPPGDYVTNIIYIAIPIF